MGRAVLITWIETVRRLCDCTLYELLSSLAYDCSITIAYPSQCDLFLFLSF